MNLSEALVDQLNQVPLFRGIASHDLIHLLKCLQAEAPTYSPETYIFRQEDVVDSLFIILEGSVSLLKEDYQGNTSLLLKLTPMHLFGESIVATPTRLSPVTIITNEQCTLLKIPYIKILRSCSQTCHFHYQLVQNMMFLLGQKNYALNQKIDLLLLKGIREKLLAYLTLESKRQGSSTFIIGLNRTQLAAYLNVSRPSMCRELALLKSEGIIDYYQNTFQLLKR